MNSSLVNYIITEYIYSIKYLSSMTLNYFQEKLAQFWSLLFHYSSYELRYDTNSFIIINLEFNLFHSHENPIFCSLQIFYLKF